MKCVAPTCPIAKGECDSDGECYLWRCEHPSAPRPEDELAAFADIILHLNAARMVS